MMIDPNHEERLVTLDQQLRRARTITPKLLSDAIATACVRLASAHQANARSCVDRLIDSGAWVDATLTLVALELPQWQIRRLVHEDGEWLCSLSKQPQLPFGFDDICESFHELLPLAVLGALVQARRTALAHSARPRAVPAVRQAPGHAVCCDNFV